MACSRCIPVPSKYMKPKPKINSIPFLRFPFLVIQEVISIMDPMDIIHLAMLSKRAKRIIKYILNTKLRNKYQTEVYISNKYGIGFKNDNRGWYYMYTSKRGHRCSTVWKGFDMSTSWFLRNFTYKILEDFENLFNLFQDLFGVITGLDLDMNCAEIRLIIDFLKTKQESFKWCKVCNIVDRGEEIKHLLETLNITKTLYISSTFFEIPEIDLFENVENLVFQYSPFIKPEQLLALKSKQIVLHFTSFTNEDISAILKSWMASESNLNLEHLMIGFFSTTTDDILEDIPNEDGEDFQVDEGSGKMKSVEAGPDIQRDDGKKARVIFSTEDGKTTLDIYTH